MPLNILRFKLKNLRRVQNRFETDLGYTTGAQGALLLKKKNPELQDLVRLTLSFIIQQYQGNKFVCLQVDTAVTVPVHTRPTTYLSVYIWS